ncbi:ATP-binding cassette domain-containing protein [Paenibacillus rhizoplanae]
MIEIRDLHKSFGPLAVLKGVDLTVEHGQVMVIIGPSGSGKNHAAALLQPAGDPPDKGSLTLNTIKLDFTPGAKIPQRTVLSLRQQTGMVFQSYNLFPHMTAIGNVMEGQITVQKAFQGGSAQQGAGTLGQGGSGRQGRCVSASAVRRPAAARSNSPRHGGHAGGAAVR